MEIDFDNIRNNIEMRKYRLIGSGSGRHVFDLDNGFVVKMAKNRRGLAQNRAEYQISLTDHSHIFAKITAVSEDFHYLIMEKAEKIKSIKEVCNYYHVNNSRELLHKEEFRDLFQKNNLLPADLRRYNSWGLVMGKPVIIDFGFTREVSRYYTLF